MHDTLIRLVVVGLLVTLVLCSALVITKGWHGRFTFDASYGVQKFQPNPTPRIGGVGLFGGAAAMAIAAKGPEADVLVPMVLAGIPAFGSGIAEDITKRVGPWTRLVATMSSGLIGYAMTGVALHSTGFSGLDHFLQWTPFAVFFTCFAVSGVTNAINIVDGFHGLASGLVAMALVGLAFIAWQSGDIVLATVALAIGCVVLGFMAVNFPFGKIFLGDGGAYVLGFWLAWVAVLLTERNPRVSHSAVLLVCAYPVFEVVFSIGRRLLRSHHPMHPDRLHLHSLIRQRVVRSYLPHLPPVLQNAAVSPMVWAIALLPVVWGTMAWQSSAMAYWGLAVFVVSYLLIYRRLVRFTWARAWGSKRLAAWKRKPAGAA